MGNRSCGGSAPREGSAPRGGMRRKVKTLRGDSAGKAREKGGEMERQKKGRYMVRKKRGMEKKEHGGGKDREREGKESIEESWGMGRGVEKGVGAEKEKRERGKKRGG